MDLDKEELKETKKRNKSIKNYILKSDLKKIIYPNPENSIDYNIQINDWYKKLIEFIENY